MVQKINYYAILISFINVLISKEISTFNDYFLSNNALVLMQRSVAFRCL